jgi:hypothetical protein
MTVIVNYKRGYMKKLISFSIFCNEKKINFQVDETKALLEYKKIYDNLNPCLKGRD